MQLFRRALSLWLAVYLAMPGLLWAAEVRDLKVEELVQNAREGSTLWVLTIGVSQYVIRHRKSQIIPYVFQRCSLVMIPTHTNHLERSPRNSFTIHPSR